MAAHPGSGSSGLRLGAWALLFGAQLGAGPAAAQVAPPQPVSPFDMVGFLEEATLDAPDLLAGGTLTVNGIRIVVPRNTVLQMPALALTWAQVFELAPPPYGPTQSGLALRDVPPPLTTYEVHVQGNRVGDAYVAGLLFLSQQSLQTGQGWVTFVDYPAGELRVGGRFGDPACPGPACSGTRVRINTPGGRYGRAWSPDVRFTSDEGSPTVRSRTGFPMCLPRTDPLVADDPLCPQGNRPRDPASPTGFAPVFTMPAPGLTLYPDPRLAAPFEVGDFVTYSGILQRDGAQPGAGPFPAPPGSTYVAAHTLLADVGIFTFPGTDPAYLATDVLLLGVGGAPAPGLPQEATVRTRFEGFTTDPTRVVYLYGIDVDPCTGAQTPRSWGAVGPDPGPPTGAVKGRWRFIPPSKVLLLPPAGTFLPPTRELRAVLGGAQPVVTGNGLVAGQYQAPIFDFLFPENLGVGSPPVPLNFQDFPFLAQGSGPLGAAVVGQLAPWPGGLAPAQAPSCAPPALAPPHASAGAAQVVSPGALVALDGSGSSDPGGHPLTYAWSQTAGPPVLLAGSAGPSPTFVAPAPPAGSTQATLGFSLAVGNGALISTAATTVTVSARRDLVTISLVEYRIGRQRLTVNAASSATDGSAILTLQGYGSGGAPLQMTSLGGGRYAVVATGVAQPALVTVTSSLGGSAVSPVTRVRN